MTHYSPGQVIFTGQPYAFVLLSDEKGKRCDHCLFTCDNSQITCTKCSSVFYCSRQCKESSVTIHQLECNSLQKQPLLPLTRLIIRTLHRISTDTEYYECVGDHKRTWNDLMDHYYDISRDASAMFTFEKIFTQLETIFNKEFDVKYILSVYGKILINSFAIQDAYFRPIARGVYLGASIFDHSCAPNAVFSFNGTRITITCINEINGPLSIESSVYISYLDEMETTCNRRKHLSASYYFNCNCSRCTRSHQTFLGISMDEDRQLKRLCDSLFECNLDSSALYINLLRLKRTESTFHLSKYRQSHQLLACDDEMSFEKRIQLMNDISSVKSLLLQSSSVTSLILQDTLAMYCFDSELLRQLIDKFIQYYGQHHPRVALKYYQCAMITDDLYVRQKNLTQSKAIASTCSLLQLIKLIDCALKETQDELRAAIKVKNVKLKCTYTGNEVVRKHFYRQSNVPLYYGNNVSTLYSQSKSRYF